MFRNHPTARLLSLALLAAFSAAMPSPLPAQTPVPLPGQGSQPPIIRPQPAPVPTPPTPRPGTTTRGQRLQFTAAPLGEVIELYQQLTGKRIIRDPKVENVTVTIESSGAMPTEEAVEFIEKSLLLAGYAFVPSGRNMVKILSFEGGRLPASEGVPMILAEERLPQTDQVVSYLLQLQHLNSEEAAQAFAQIIPPHPYGKLTPVPNAKALIITENSNTIRAYIELCRQVDVPPHEVKHKSIHLERADAAEVAKALAELLDLGASAGSSQNLSSRPPAAPSTGRSSPADSKATSAPASIPVTSALGSAEAEAVPPKIQAIERTNTLLVVARPLDIQYIESLVAEYDAASPQKSFVSRKLRYLRVMDFLEVARNALLRGAKDSGEGSASAVGSPQTTSTTTASSSNNSTGFGNSFGGSGVGNSGLGGGFGPSGFGSGSTQAAPADVQPRSVLIGKTLVIADPSGSQFYASGPPEQLRILMELAEELDKRPRQILLTAVIGEFTLGNDFSFGVDWLRTLESVGNDGLVGGVLNTTGGELPDFTKFGGIEDFVAPQGLAVYGHVGKHLNVFLRTLEQNRRFHVLQKPTVTALNHELSSIYIGQQLAIPGQTLTSAGTNVNSPSVVSTTDYVPVRLQLDITPHIYANNEVRLDFEQKNMDVSGFTEISGNRVPNISEQGIKNTIIVPDRSTILLGGLITERDTNNKSGLPFLVRVPVLKHLFGSTTKSKERRELMIFVQPHILADGVDHLDAQSRWAEPTQSYPSNKQFAEDTIHVPVSGPGTTTPILPLPDWNGTDTPQRRNTDLPPSSNTTVSLGSGANTPGPDKTSKQRANDRTRLLKK